MATGTAHAEGHVHGGPGATAGFLEQPSEFLYVESGIADNTCHSDGVNRIGTGNGENAVSIGHDDVFALPDNLESSFLESTDRLFVGYPWKLGH